METRVSQIDIYLMEGEGAGEEEQLARLGGAETPQQDQLPEEVPFDYEINEDGESLDGSLEFTE